ncbi:MAG: hypothetical protein HY287_05215 [Planctomycetes bacterium]|nr:hypothetical protein [Planctomycetota bacterium]MBI3833712.1 hypothetical protein [Planctomycetota bacterium]
MKQRSYNIVNRVFRIAIIGSTFSAGLAIAGPDIIVTNISGVNNYDSVGTGAARIDAFSIGTNVCNRGDAPAGWDGNTNDHAVIRQGMFRLLNGRFEQIGTSWCKHNFPAGNLSGACGVECVQPNLVSNELRSGCSDSNSSGINGDRVNTGPSSEINAFTGEFPNPPSHVTPQTTIDQRIQVHHADLDPAANNGATYFMQAHYVQPDDALAGAGENNLAYRPVAVAPNPADTFDAQIAGVVTYSDKPAIYAWKDADPLVVLVEARVPDEGLFLVAGKASNLGDGYWRYEYAIENVNSDRSMGIFTIPLPIGAIVRNIGFHDVDYHSGEPWRGNDWASTVETLSVSWRTEDFIVNSFANALRWSTLYNFRFEANVGPAPSSVALGLFKPGTPGKVEILSIGPALSFLDCNGNGVQDACDVSCAGCVSPCGGSADCDANGVPDECEPDCNGNGIADVCDLRDCAPRDSSCADCNGNGVPDGCDEDCDGDGVPDDCDASQDFDGDGVTNCSDLCPTTTPAGTCDLSPTVTCFVNGFCLYGATRDLCSSSKGSIVCGDLPCPGSSCPRCRGGCVIGDGDGDGDIDLRDLAQFSNCFSDSSGDSDVCLFHFDADSNGNVDSVDAQSIIPFMSGPQ